MAQQVLSYLIRPAADLGASAVYTSVWVPCKGARMVAMRARATNAQGGTIGALEGANQLLASSAGHTPANAGIVLAGTWSSLDHSIRGGSRIHITPGTGMTWIDCDAVRINYTNGGGIATGFEVFAEVYYDDAAVTPTGQVTF